MPRTCPAFQGESGRCDAERPRSARARRPTRLAWVESARKQASRQADRSSRTGSNSPRGRSSVVRADRVELDSVDERVLVDRPGVRGACAQRLTVALAGPQDIVAAHRRKRDELDRIDLDLSGTDAVAAALPDSRPL